MTDHWILCVDDDEKLLQGLDLHLGLDHDVRTAPSGDAGLALLRSHADCAVIISDMRMPGMNGTQFLTAARALSPDSTRMLLTGYSDIDSAVCAVNDGGIFRFLMKPTSAGVLKVAVAESLRQWELVRSERVLLEQTLHGAAEALVEALEIACPSTFSRSRRLESATRHVAEVLEIEPVWTVALAGLLIRLGWISVPSDVVDAKLSGRRTLTDAERAMFVAAHATSVRLVRRIPRLDVVASIIEQARRPSGAIDGGTALRTIVDYDELCIRGLTSAQAIAKLSHTYPAAICDALATWKGARDRPTTRDVTVDGVVEGMVAEQDIVTASGVILLRAGTEITETLVDRLRNFAHKQGVVEPIVVSTPDR